MLLITQREAKAILSTPAGTLQLSFDLGKSMQRVIVSNESFLLEGKSYSKEQLKKIDTLTNVYILSADGVQKVAFFSPETNYYYKLVPTKDWPTFTISSTPMHLHTHTSPKEHAQQVVKEISPIRGRVLDTCCGLGYTAILASQLADEVHTFEIDKTVIELEKLNPHSADIFLKKNIRFSEGDIHKEISRFADHFFDSIIHDPPTFKYAPLLYSSAFYQELYRVLKRQGILYHYAPWPKKTKQNTFYEGIVKRLKLCGFVAVHYSERSSGIKAIKR